MFQPDDIIGPYKLIKYLGVGEFGVVWLAENQEVVSPERALKLFTDPRIKWEDVKKKEVTVWKKATGHPNILGLIEAKEYGRQIVIASEYADGGSLAAWLQTQPGKKPSSIAKTIELMLGILAGLEHLHGRDILHRDLKPANVLLQGGTPRLTDFGSSRITSTVHHTNYPRTLSYSPPESVDDFSSELTDIWAAGVFLYRLLTGRLPFPQENQYVLMKAIINNPPDPLPPAIPMPLQEIVWKALKKKMEDRFQSATAMRQALLQVNHSPAPPKTIQPEPSPRRNIIQIDFESPLRPTSAPSQPAPEADDGPTRVVRPQPPVVPKPASPPVATAPDRIVVDSSLFKKSVPHKPYIENLNGVPLEMILVPAGKFTRGSDKSDDEKPPHEVRVSSFYIGKFQITQKQWQAVMGKDTSYFKGDELPVECVSWNDAQAFCEKLQAMTDKAFRLLSEAEWEYACRAGMIGDYWGNLDEMAWYDKNSGGKTHPVGQKKPNRLGLYDMHGNVWEWCEDVWHDNYKDAPKDGSAWTNGGDRYCRVLRGGTWGSDGNGCRSARRNYSLHGARSNYFGFRVVVSAGTP